MCSVNCVVCLTDQRPFFLTCFLFFFFTFVIQMQEAFCALTVRQKYRVYFFILRKSKRLNMRNWRQTKVRILKALNNNSDFYILMVSC